MNYIKHLNRVQEVFIQDPRLNASHISLYMALFYFWNLNRFSQWFYISRNEVMAIAKIGGLATYHKCLKNLSDWSYLSYKPSKNRFKGSEVMMFNFETSAEQVLNKLKTIPKQALEHNTNSKKRKTKNKKQPNSLKEAVDFFLNNNFSTKEAEKFYGYYHKLQWKTKQGNQIINWKAVAISWMDHVELFEATEKEKKVIPLSRKREPVDHLKTSKNKNYGEPL